MLNDLIKKVSEKNTKVREQRVNLPWGHWGDMVLVSEPLVFNEFTLRTPVPGNKGYIIELEEDVGRFDQNTNQYVLKPRRFEKYFIP